MKGQKLNAGAGFAHLRIARPTDRLDEVVRQYKQGLGLVEFGGFEDHEGFDGAMLGHPKHAWHLEFTKKPGHLVGCAPTEENLLVFYLPDQVEWQAAVERLAGAGFQRVTAFNPYWDRAGATFEDVDGYRVVVARQAWDGGQHGE